MTDLDVLVVGAGPIGLTLANELARRGVSCRIIDRQTERPQYAKAIGVQPRTLEIWEATGALHDALDAGTALRGQIMFSDGNEVFRLDLDLPPEVPYGFFALPQYETERILVDQLGRSGRQVEMGVELRALTRTDEGADGIVIALLAGPDGDEEVRARFIVGCDGAHSIVRKTIGLDFTGDAFPEGYMLADVELDWDFPPGYGLRITRRLEDGTDDMLVAIPLPGIKRYRLSMLASPELRIETSPAGSAGDGPNDGIAHGFEGARKPTLDDIQIVLDRLSPEPTKASNLRWSSVFRISHRLVDRYRDGNAFVAGDAAHIHPPTGAQGMNTGIQDAYNLGWKLALAAKGMASDSLLDSYHAERHPIGEAVVGRTVANARREDAGVGSIEGDDKVNRLLGEAQLLVGYPDSPIVGQDDPDGALPPSTRPGGRAPDCRGLRRTAVAFDIRLFELLKSGHHTLLLYATTPGTAAAQLDVLDASLAAAHGELTGHLLIPPDTDVGEHPILPIVDAAGTFASTYGAVDGTAYLVRPDGYIGHRAHRATADRMRTALARVFASPG